MKWEIIIPLAIIILIFLRLRIRGFFWKTKDGKKLTFKQFMETWKQGAETVTPLQQAKVSLWSFPFLYGGLLWGIISTLTSSTYWMSLLLGASLPIITMQLLSSWQKFKALKKIDEIMKEVENDIETGSGNPEQEISGNERVIAKDT